MSLLLTSLAKVNHMAVSIFKQAETEVLPCTQRKERAEIFVDTLMCTIEAITYSYHLCSLPTSPVMYIKAQSYSGSTPSRSFCTEISMKRVIESFLKVKTALTLLTCSLWPHFYFLSH